MAKSNKFGTFSGVFTPSILTILGVIMYMRLPMIIGEAGLWQTLGIILVAHIIAFATGISVSSIATDKKVQAGGTYYIISRSLGLPIGGTLGLSLFVGMSFSVSLYLIGFSESFLNYFEYEVTKNEIRIAGTLILLAVTTITFISTSLAIKTQYFIMAAIGLSLLSIFFGANHEFKPTSEVFGNPTSTVPLMVLFGIFFPAVTGFEAGVSMSGDLKDPKKSIPTGTISAIAIGFMVYISLTLFFAYTVDPMVLANNKNVLTMIAVVPVLVIIGIWGATLSSALGSILGAPRILQATAVDRITPKIFAKGVGPSNEPRNALLLSFAIAEMGILVGELDVIARVVSVFFITTYGFLNLSAAFEAWSSADFRPSFKAPIWLSLIGAAACIIVMIQLDLLAMIGATVILGLVFFYLKRKELSLETGDAWSGVWASAVKTGIRKLSVEKIHHRNWRPNIILFSGDASVRGHLINLGTQISGKLGMMTSFELVPTTDPILGKTPPKKMDDSDQFFSITHACHEVYEGMEEVVRVYGFSGIQPNTVLMGWSRKEQNREKFSNLLKVIQHNHYNSLFLNYHAERKYGKGESIDIWWNGSGRTLSLAINLVRYITTNPFWAKATLRLMVVNENRSMTELINKRTQKIVDDFRIDLEIHVIDNSLHMLNTREIISQYSKGTDLTIIGLPEESIEEGAKTVSNVDGLLSELGTTLIITASTGFQSLDIGLSENIILPTAAYSHTTLPELNLSKYPVIAEGIKKLDVNGQKTLNLFFEKTIAPYYVEAQHVFEELQSLKDSTASRIAKVVDLSDRKRKLKLLAQVKENFYRQGHVIIERLVKERTVSITETLEAGIQWYTKRILEDIKKIPQHLKVAYDPAEFIIQKEDSMGIRFYKLRKRFVKILTRKPMVHRVHYREVAEHYLVDNRILFMVAYLREFEGRSIEDLANHRQLLNHVADSLDMLIKQEESTGLNTALLKKELQQLDDQFAFANKKMAETKELSHGRLLLEYRINLQKMNGTLSRLSVNSRAEKFSKQRKAYRKKLDVLQAGAENWQRNLIWTANKVYAEMLIREIMSHAEELLRNYETFLHSWFDVHYYQPSQALRDEFTTLLNDRQADVRLAVHFDPNQILELTNQFTQRTTEINELITPLPDDITIIVEIGKDDQAESQSLPLRSMTSHFIESRLISKGEDHLEKVSEGLRKSNFIIKDIANLVKFGLDNALKNDTGLPDDNFIKIIEESIQNLLHEEKRIKELEAGLSSSINELFIGSFEPLQPFRINASATEFYAFARGFRGKKVKSKIIDWSRKGLGWTKNLSAKLLYSISGGVLMAKQFTATDSNVSQSSKILDLVEAVSPSPAIFEQLPFYYKNLFSGRSNIGNDFWVARPKEEEAFQKALQRYDQGLHGAIMILGNKNQGKTALAKYILAKFVRERQTFHAFPPKAEAATSEVFNTVLQKVTGFSGSSVEILESIPHGSILHIHDMECWWERRSGGYEVIKEMLNLINLYSNKCLFILSSNPQAYNLINRVLTIQHHFISVIECQPFTAEDLKNLILLRHKSSGLKFTIKDRPEDELSAFRTARIFNEYFEYSRGNPGVALNGWLSDILSINEKTLNMRMPGNRSFGALRDLKPTLLVVLSEVVLHRRTTIPKLMRIMGLPLLEVEGLLYALQRMGLLYENTPGVFAINTYVESFISQLLEERELL